MVNVPQFNRFSVCLRDHGQQFIERYVFAQIQGHNCRLPGCPLVAHGFPKTQFPIDVSGICSPSGFAKSMNRRILARIRVR